MKATLHLILILLITAKTEAQHRNDVWCFGDSAGIDFSNLSNPVIFSTSLDTRGSCVSIADSMGNLLFYANTRATLPDNTTRVWNKFHNLMLNGDSIVGGGWYKELTLTNISSFDSLYYLFSAGVTNLHGLFYSIIDMSLDNGHGAVTQKNIQLQDSDFWCNDGLAAIKHGNGRDWWIIARNWQFYSDTFYFYLVTPTGINLDHIQKIGDNVQSGFFRIEPSNDGSKVACVTNKGLLSVFDFDRCSGLLSNSIFIEHENPNFNLLPWYWACEISPNNQFLYISKNYTLNDSNNYVLQFDLLAANVAASRDTIYSVPLPANAGLFQIGPDNKMYWSCSYNPPFTFMYPYPDSVYNNINMNLSVINYPDSAGLACNFQPFSFYLGGKRTYWGLPNNPNYDLQKLAGSVCDTLQFAGVAEQQASLNPKLQVSYISSWQKLFVNAQNLKGKNCTIKIFDVNGREVFTSSKKTQPPYYTCDVDVSKLSSGCYLVNLITEREMLSIKFVKY